MRLFTSNSDICFIVKCTLICLAIVLVYTVIAMHIPKEIKGANQWQTNVIKAQEFMFNDKNYQYIMVGSSMAYNVHVEKLSSKAFNLALAGGDSLTGLEIINMKMIRKETIVLIEVNSTVMRGIDDKILDKTEKMYKYLPFLQDINRPDVVIFQYLQKVKRFFKPEIVGNYKDLDKPVASALNRQQDAHDVLIPQEELEKKVDELYSQVSKLQAQGAKVILFEPPMDSSLYALKRTAQVREVLLKKFPVDNFDWFKINWNKFKTRDGIHLDKNSADQYANALLEYAVLKNHNNIVLRTN